MWKATERPEDLPPPGTRESAFLDFKLKGTDDRFEVAKDVAAFANSGGGTILVGCVGTSELERFAPLSSTDADHVARTAELAVRDFCRPPALLGVARIPIDGGSAVAINVWPMPGMLIGLRLPRPPPGQTDHAFVFPLRIGTHTTFISPEQLPMFLDARARRIALLLSEFVGQRAVVVADRPRSDSRSFVDVVTVRSVDLFTNVIEVIAPRVERKPEFVAVFPLDYVKSACILGNTRLIYLDGSLTSLKWGENAPVELKALSGFLDPDA